VTRRSCPSTTTRRAVAEDCCAEERTGFCDAEPGHVCSDTRISGAAAQATLLAFQPDGAALLTGNDGLGLLRWRAADRLPLELFELRGGPLSPCGVDSMGRFALLRSREAAGRPTLLWVDSQLHRRQLLSGLVDAVRCCAVGPGGRQVLAGDAAGRVLLWDAGKPTAALQLAPAVQRRHHSAAINCCALSADGLLAATGKPRPARPACMAQLVAARPCSARAHTLLARLARGKRVAARCQG
jgi:hypothetical protein